jgi:type I restriction enzyme R subunit
LVNALNYQPKVLERKVVIQRVKERLQTFIDTFIEGRGGIEEVV